MEPIAIIGCAGRFPGAPDVEAYWKVLNGVGEALSDIPAERFDIDAFFDANPGTVGKTYCRRGGFLSDIDRFDHAFFGMTPREALAADPQRRLRGVRANPLVAGALKDSAISILTEAQAWKADTQRRVAGVSSFGFGGANAHMIVEAADRYLPPMMTALEPRDALPQLLPLSAKSELALRQLAQRTTDWLNALPPDHSLFDICRTAQTGRTHFPYRFTAVGHDAAALSSALMRLASAHEPVASAPPRGPFAPAFVFSGQGTLHAGVARTLLGWDAFRSVLERCDALVRQEADWSLLNVLEHTGDDAALNATAVAQPLLYAIQCGLAQTMMDAGVAPGAVLGHSLGEYSAAWVAGVFELEDGLRLVLERARLMSGVRGQGGMLAVAAAEAEVRACFSDWPDDLEIACRNAPEAIVVAGPLDLLDNCAARLAASGVRVHRLATSHAFHTRMMQPAQEAFRQFAARFTFHAPKHPFVSSVSGEVIAGEHDWPAYWAGQICAPDSPLNAFAASLRARGEPVITAWPTPSTNTPDDSEPVVIPADQPQRVSTLVQDMAATGRVRLIVCAGYFTRPGDELDHAMLAVSCQLSAALLAILSEHPTGTVRPWLVTNGAQQLGDKCAAPPDSALWGVFKTALAEYPDRFAGLIDIASQDDGSLETLRACVSMHAATQVLALRKGQAYREQLQTLLAEATTFRARADASYLITGVFGGIGLRLAQHLLDRGAGALLLQTRRPPSPEQERQLDAWRTRGTRVAVIVDALATEDRVTEALATLGLPLAGIFHLAGARADAPMAAIDDNGWKQPFAAKLGGVPVLRSLANRCKLDALVYFSSIASLVGSPAQANYVAANAVLEGIAREDRRNGLPATCILWGPWAEVGAAAQLSTAQQQRLQQGFGNLSGEALQVLAQRIAEPAGDAYVCPALEQGGARLVAAMRDIDRARYRALLPTLDLPTLWLRGAHSQHRRPRDEQELQAALPAARIGDLDGGHNLHIDASAALADALLAFVSHRQSGNDSNATNLRNRTLACKAHSKPASKACG